MAQIPNLPIHVAVERLGKAYAVIGTGPAYERSAIAHALGYTNAQSGRFAANMTSFQLYGLIDRSSNRYSFTPLFTRIFSAPHSEDGKAALAEAAMRPPVFKAPHDTFNGSRLPTDLPRWLLHQNHGKISDAEANRIALLFTENAEAAGILRDGLLLPDSRQQVFQEKVPETPQQRAVASVPEISSQDPHTFATLEKDFGDGRIVRISVPNDLTETERDNLTTLIQYL